MSQSASTRQTERSETGLTSGQIVFLVILLVVGVGLMGFAAFHFIVPPPPPPPGVAEKAEVYLRARKSTPIFETLEELAADANRIIVPTQPHPLLGKPAPDFRLVDHENKPLRLSALVAKGPVIVVFYYGYWCDHCVAQLFSLDEDMKRFRALGASVVAISGDPPEQTAERLAERKAGPFAFPVLSDPEQKVATLFGAHLPARDGKPARQLHGTFIVGSDGLVHWADLGDQPFIQTKSLLYDIAKLQGLAPASSTGKR